MALKDGGKQAGEEDKGIYQKDCRIVRGGKLQVKGLLGEMYDV